MTVSSDPGDLWTEIRATHQRLDTLRDRFDQNTTFLIQRMDGMQAELRREIAASTDGLRKELAASTDGLRKELATSTDGLRKEIAASTSELRAGMGTIKDSLAAAKIWATIMWFTLAGSLLLVIGRAFKWI